MSDSMTQVDLRELAIDRGETETTALRQRRHMLTRYVLPASLAVGFVLLVGWAARDYVFPPRKVTVVPVLATTAEVRREGTPLFKAAGWIEPRPTPIRVAALAEGTVAELLVVEDQHVKVGQEIAKLVKDDAKLAHDKALADQKLREAELGLAMADLKAAETRLKQPVHLEAALGEAEAALAKIETQLKNLPFEIRRAEADLAAVTKDYDGKVASKGVVSGIDIDIAKSKRDAGKALVAELSRRDESLKKEQAALIQRRDALKTQLKLLADEIKAKERAEANVKSARARVAQATVSVKEAKLRLDRMTICSPIDGRVFQLIGHPGAHVGGGTSHMTGRDASTVVTLYRPDRLQIRVDVRFEDLPKVSLKQPVRIENPALSSPLTGNVLFISSEADIQKNTLQVKVDIPNPPEVFKPEMLVDVTFLEPPRLEQKTATTKELKLYIPRQLVHDGDGEYFVWIADQSEGIARKTTVKLGAEGVNGLVEITSGLSVSNRVIVGGADGLRDRERIRITGEDSSFGTADTQQSKSGKPKLNRLPGG